MRCPASLSLCVSRERNKEESLFSFGVWDEDTSISDLRSSSIFNQLSEAQM